MGRPAGNAERFCFGTKELALDGGRKHRCLDFDGRQLCLQFGTQTHRPSRLQIRPAPASAWSCIKLPSVRSISSRSISTQSEGAGATFLMELDGRRAGRRDRPAKHGRKEMSGGLRIGLDFDNTIITYDAVFLAAARSWALLARTSPAESKRFAIRSGCFRMANCHGKSCRATFTEKVSSRQRWLRVSMLFSGAAGRTKCRLLSSATRPNLVTTIPIVSICARRREHGCRTTVSFRPAVTALRPTPFISRIHGRTRSRVSHKSAALILSTIWKKFSPIRRFLAASNASFFPMWLRRRPHISCARRGGISKTGLPCRPIAMD